MQTDSDRGIEHWVWVGPAIGLKSLEARDLDKSVTQVLSWQVCQAIQHKHGGGGVKVSCNFVIGRENGFSKE